MCNLKAIYSIILIQVVINSYSSLSDEESSTNNNELKMKSLHGCLATADVNGQNLIQRNGGIKYNELNRQWNTLNGKIMPMAYLVANNESDVQIAVYCCKLLKIRLVPRSGGHSLVKNCYGDSRSVVIDLAKLNKISINRKRMTCEVGPGARVGLINNTLWKEGKFMIPIGICPTVSVAGLTLGGGYGAQYVYTDRTVWLEGLGLTSDNLIELEMVDTNGMILVINNSTNVDLFWALRGAGGGSFGIVTKLKFRIYSTPKSIAYGIYAYRLDDFQQFFEAWQSLISSIVQTNIGTLLTMEKDSIGMQIYKFNYEKEENVTSSAVDFDDFLGSFSFPNPVDSGMNLLSYSDFVLTTSQDYSTTPLTDLSQLANISSFTSVAHTKVKSIYVDKILQQHDISKLKFLISDYLEWGILHMELNGGAINKFSQSDTAFIHRGKNQYHIQLQASGLEDELNLKTMDSAMRTFYEESKKIFRHRESYQNYLDEDIPDYLERYYGANLKKLIQVKMKIDPENLFRHPQSIPVNYEYVRTFENVNGYDFM